MRDAAILMRSMAGHDPKDTTSVDRAVPDYEAAIGKSVKGMKIGIPKEYRLDGMPAEIEKLWTEGAAWLKAAGAELVEVSLPHTKYALPAYYIVAPAEASSNLARYDGVRYGLRVPGRSIGEMYENTRAEGFGDEVRRRVMIGTYVLSAGYYDAYYLRAQKVRTLIKKDFEDCFAKGVHAILTPATPSAAFGIGEKGGADPVEMYLNDIFTVTVNMAGLPGIAVPAGKDAQGLPLGLQLIGRPFDEETLFSLGEVIEQAAGRFTPREVVVSDGRFQSQPVGRGPRAGLDRRWPHCGGPPRATGTQAHKIVQDEDDALTPPGSTPICIASRAISAMPATGTGRPASRSRRIRSKPNGSGSFRRCSGVEKHERASQAGKLIKGATGDWEMVIGLEVHAQVTSNSKLFSGASTEFGGEPNTHVSLVDAAMPGMLPVINEECVRQAVRTGLGLNAQINLRSVFDRKNYFYPDLPQGYQISQYKSPIVGEGEVVVELDGGETATIGHRAAASGAGRRQVAARPEPDHVLCRPQPLRRGADGDRLQARHPRCRAGQGLCDQAALDPALSRHLRRRHGEGLACAPTSTSPCASRATRSAPAARSRT